MPLREQRQSIVGTEVGNTNRQRLAIGELSVLGTTLEEAQSTDAVQTLGDFHRGGLAS